VPALHAVVAANIIAEVGDFSRFAHPRQLVAYFGLAPGEHSSGGTTRPRGITKAGSSLARSVRCADIISISLVRTLSRLRHEVTRPQSRLVLLQLNDAIDCVVAPFWRPHGPFTAALASELCSDCLALLLSS
jgi:hypothetical protein